MVTMKFLPDMYVNRCIACKGCEAACKTQNKTPENIRRIRVVTFNKGEPNETNIPMPCLHCTDPPCLHVCPVNVIYKREDGVVLLNKEGCIGCGYCLFACPFGAPQFEQLGAFGTKGKMDKCTFCVEPYEQRDNQGKLIKREPKPRCSLFCAAETLLAGDVKAISEKMRQRQGSTIFRSGGAAKTFLTF